MLALEICKKTPPIALKGSMDEDDNKVKIDGRKEELEKASLAMIGWLAWHLFFGLRVIGIYLHLQDNLNMFLHFPGFI